MVFYCIGLGLGDARDTTIRGLEIIKRCSKVYLENYTSIMCCGLDKGKIHLEEFYGRPILEAERFLLEEGADQFLEEARRDDIALLVIGDPFSATTHIELLLRAKRMGIDAQPVHNTSIVSAVGCSGLQVYSFGEIVSIVLWSNEWKPDSYYDKILRNLSNGLHTLCLLDIKTKEQSIENLMREKKVYEPPRFMTCSEAANQLLEISMARQDDVEKLDRDALVVGMARIGWHDQKIVFCSLDEMRSVDLGSPLHSLIIPSKKLHPLEFEMLQTFSLHK